jgi:hypothetical protein
MATSRDRIRALRDIRARHLGNAASAQRSRLLEALQILGSITTIEAARFLDVFDPRARKLDLLKAGHTILMTWDVDQTEAGVTHRIGRYSIVKGASR